MKAVLVGNQPWLRRFLSGKKSREVTPHLLFIRNTNSGPWAGPFTRQTRPIGPDSSPGHVPETAGHVPETAGHVPEFGGHVPETAGHVGPKYARTEHPAALPGSGRRVPAHRRRTRLRRSARPDRRGAAGAAAQDHRRPDEAAHRAPRASRGKGGNLPGRLRSRIGRRPYGLALQGAPDRWPGPSPGTASPLDCLCLGSA